MRTIKLNGISDSSSNPEMESTRDERCRRRSERGDLLKVGTGATPQSCQFELMILIDLALIMQAEYRFQVIEISQAVNAVMSNRSPPELSVGMATTPGRKRLGRW